MRQEKEGKEIGDRSFVSACGDVGLRFLLSKWAKAPLLGGSFLPQERVFKAVSALWDRASERPLLRGALAVVRLRERG